MMMHRIIVMVLMAVIGLLFIWWWLHQAKSEQSPVGQQSPVHQVCGIPSADSVASEYSVPIIGSGIAVPELAIKVGQTVRWENQDAQPHQIVADPHPGHHDCFGLDSAELPAGDSFAFTFTLAGTWGYHDELNPAWQGVVVVTE